MAPNIFLLNDYISNRLEEIEDMVGYMPSLCTVDENNVSYKENEPDGGNMLYYLAGEADTLREVNDFIKCLTGQTGRGIMGLGERNAL